MAIYNKQVKFTRTQLIGHLHRRNSIADYIYGLFRFLAIIVQNLYCVSSYLVLSWIILLPIGWIRSDLYSRAENYLYNSLLFIVSSWSLASGATIVEAGEDFKRLIEEPENQNESYKYEQNNNNTNTNSHPNNNNINYHKNVNGKQQRHVMNNVDSALTNGFNTNTNKDYFNSANHNNYHHTHVTRSTTKQRLKNSSQILLNGSNGVITMNNQAGDAVLMKKANIQQFEDQYQRINGYSNLLTAEDENYTNHNNNIENHNNNNHLMTAKKSKVNGYSNNVIESSLVKENRTLSVLNEKSPLKSNQAKPRILLLCNHISTADVPLMMQAFSTLTNQSLLWVLDAQFKPTNFGVVCGSHGDFFVAKNSFAEGALRDQVLKHPDRNLLVLFPEGGFLRKRLEGSNRYATKNGLPLTKYVTHPRFGAFKDLIDPSVGVTHIVDATLLYDDIKNPLSILDIALGTRKEPAILNYKVYKRSEINPTEEWLRSIWLEKDKLLQRFYEDRASVYSQFEASGPFRVAILDWFKVLSVHLFYLLVCYLAIFRLFNATSVTMLKARELYYSNI